MNNFLTPIACVWIFFTTFDAPLLIDTNEPQKLYSERGDCDSIAAFYVFER